MDPPQLSIDALNTTTPNLAHLYIWQMDPPQLCIDALNTTTPNLADLYMYRIMRIYPWQIDPTPSFN